MEKTPKNVRLLFFLFLTLLAATFQKKIEKPRKKKLNRLKIPKRYRNISQFFFPSFFSRFLWLRFCFRFFKPRTACCAFMTG